MSTSKGEKKEQKYLIAKFNLDKENPEHLKAMDFFDTLGRGYRAKFLVACARNFYDMHPREVRKIIDDTEEVIVKYKPLEVDLYKRPSIQENHESIKHKEDENSESAAKKNNVSTEAKKKSSFSGLVKAK